MLTRVAACRLPAHFSNLLTGGSGPSGHGQPWTQSNLLKAHTQRQAPSSPLFVPALLPNAPRAPACDSLDVAAAHVLMVLLFQRLRRLLCRPKLHVGLAGGLACAAAQQEQPSHRCKLRQAGPLGGGALRGQGALGSLCAGRGWPEVSQAPVIRALLVVGPAPGGRADPGRRHDARLPLLPWPQPLLHNNLSPASQTSRRPT